MHLKNLAMLKTAEVDAKAFTSVRFAPLYDAVTTRAFPGLGGDRMALKLNGKDDRLTRLDFMAFARTIGLTSGNAEGAIIDLTRRVEDYAKTLSLPAFAAESEAARSMQGQVIALVRDRCTALPANTD